MRKVFVGQTPFHAHFVRGLLETAGIDAEVRNELLYGARGELPVTEDMLPSVWVDEGADLPAAIELVRRYESGEGPRVAPGSSWTCPSCGECLEGQFTSCWQCGESKPQE